jgi:hypothetical protein
MRTNTNRLRTEVFLREDIQNILRAIDRANGSLASNLPMAEVAIYRAGFAAALGAVAEAFDVQLSSPATAQLDLDHYLQLSPQQTSTRS